MKKEAISLSPRDRRLVMKFLAGGAAAGGAYGLGTSLANYLQDLKSEADVDDDTGKDDNTLYLDLPQHSLAKDASIGGGLAITGGTLAGLGTYSLVKKLYQDIKRKRIQDQLDSAQQIYLGNLSGVEEGDDLNPEDLQKGAAADKPMGGMELLTSAPIAIPLLLGIASGAVTHHTLSKFFPRTKQPKVTGPKRVVIRRKKKKEAPAEDIAPVDGELDPELEELEELEGGREVMASYDDLPGDWQDADGVEEVARLLMSHPKTASEDLRDFVGAMSSGQHDLLVDGLEGGLGQCFSLVKGASEHLADKAASSMGLGLACRSNLMGPTFSVLVASEFNEHYPHYVKAAAALSPEAQHTLRKIAGVLGAMSRRDYVGVRSSGGFAKESSGLASALMQAISADDDAGAGLGQDVHDTAGDLDVSYGDRSDDEQHADNEGEAGDMIDDVLDPDVMGGSLDDQNAEEEI